MFAGKKVGSKNKRVMLLAALLIAGMAGAAAWYISSRPQPLEGLVPAIGADLAAHYSNAAISQNRWNAEYVTSLPQSVPGYDFSVSSASAPTLRYGLGYWAGPKPKTVKKYFFFKHEVPAASSVAMLTGHVRTYLANNRFTYTGDKTSTISFTLNLATTTKQVTTSTFVRGTDTCLLATEQDSSTYQVSCFSADTWRDIASQDEPFVHAYLAKHPASTARRLTFGPLTIKSKQPSGVITASKRAGYDLAEAVVVDSGKKSLALYYQKSGTWHYITSASDEFGFSCPAILANPDARAAMYDQVCYAPGSGQVRVDSTRRALQ